MKSAKHNITFIGTYTHKTLCENQACATLA